jgi:predicted neuraminidase
MQSLPNEISSLVYKGHSQSHCCCDSTWRRLPGGDHGVFFLTGSQFEPEPGNYVGLCRSSDEGETWGPVIPVITNPPGGVTLSEVVVHEGVISIYLQIHDGSFDRWRTAVITSKDDARTWSEPVEFAPVPHRSMIRNLYQTSWGEWLLPYQYYEPVDGNWQASVLRDGSHIAPWNGVLSAPTPHGPWTDSQRIRGARGWAEVNVVELRDGRVVMLARSDGEGALLRSESTDRGRTWSPYVRSDIPNPGSKFRLFRLKDGRIALLHNPSGITSHANSKLWASVNRNPLALWISDDDMKSWAYQRVISSFPGMLAYPDGEVDPEERFIHFAFDYNRHDVIYWKVSLPE